MGLFDHFRITSGPFEGDGYQTKDLGSTMSTYRVGDGAVLEEETVHREKRPLTDERREELQAYVEEKGEGLGAFHERYAIENGYESVETHRTWDRVTYTGTAHVYEYDSETEESLDLVLEFKAGVLVSLRKGEENKEEGWWNTLPVGPSYPPAYEGPVTVVVGPTVAELEEAFPSARLF
ncbi:hypothetical protein [Rubricoccus marinus]|uniref:Uncharacterized protein n=1 Tax=Rubricoccus marinus TaxID=716817 RepID=A0A259TUL5_9BACT|nr:hypothetical protein [Rubricoccus marinus]OZC01248.1 hypothetical protein BSZ36_18535 [Rubricoccus marinus]